MIVVLTIALTYLIVRLIAFWRASRADGARQDR
jgi:hypothetical protein